MATVERVLESINFRKIENLLEGHFKSTGMVVGILDLKGKILATSSWQPICRDFHRAKDESCKRCTESDIELGAKKVVGKDYHSYNCLNGLVDVVTPVVINELHVANLYCGQLLYEKPDLEKFKKQADLFGYNKEKYLKALADVPIVSKDKIKDVMAFLNDLILEVAEMTMHKIEQERLISDIQKTEKTLRKSEERLATSQRIALLGNFEHDFDKDTLWWSDEVYNILGFSKSDIPPNFETFIGRMNKEDQQKIIGLVDNCKKYGKGYTTTYGYHIPGNEIKYILDTVEVISNKSDIPTGLKGTVQDITDQVRTKKAIEESERNYKTLFDSAPIMLGVIDIEGNYLEINNSVKDMLGYSKEDMKGENTFGYIHKEDIECVTDAFTEAIQTGSGEVIYRFKHKNGSYKTIRSRAEQIPYTENYIIFSDDITEHKKTENKLKKSEELLNMTGDIAKVGGWYLGDNLDDLFWTQTTKRIHEIPEDYQPTVEEAINYYHPDDRTLVAKSVEAAMNEGNPFDFEARLITAKGNEIWVQALGKPEMADGKISRLIGTFQDITERKKAESELKQLNHTLEVAQKMAKVGYWRFDIDSQMPTWSDQMFEVCGLKKENGVPSYSEHKETWHPDDWEMFDNAIQECIKGKPYNIVIRIWFPEDKTYHYVNTQGFPVYNNDGEITELFGTSQDISNIKRVENELRENERFISAIADTTPAMIYVYDIETNSNIYSNSGMNRLLGYSPQEIIEMGETMLSYLVHPDDFHKVIDIHNRILKASDDEILLIEYRIKHRDGSWRYMHSDEKVFLRNNDGSVKQKIGIAFDITDLKKAESNLLNNQQRLIAIFDNTSDYQVLVEVNEKDNLTIVAVNNSYINRAKNLGVKIEKDNIIGKSIIELLEGFGITKEETEKTISNYLHVARSKEKLDFIEDLVINNNSYVAEISLIPILNIEGDCQYILYNSHDISDIKLAEQELISAKELAEESEEKYRLLHENAALGIGYYTPDGVVISYNSIASHNMGGEPEDFAGKSLYELFPKEAADEYSKRLQRTVNSNEVIDYEDCVDLPTKKFWFLSTYTKIVNSENEILGIQIISQDITSIKETELALKQAKEAAEESELNLVTAQKIAKTGSWIYFPEEDKGHWSDQMYQIFGIKNTSKTPSFEKFFDLIHPDDIIISENEYKKAIETKETRSYDCRTNPENKYINAKWINISISTIVIDGKVSKLNGTVTDITDRKIVEEQIAYQSKMQEILTNLASRFINIPLNEVSAAIESALTDMGSFIDADRAYIFEYDWDKMITNNTYEWCAHGINPEIDNLQEVPLSAIPRWAETHKNGSKMLIPDTSALTDEDSLKEILESQGIKSLISIPMMGGKDCIGFVGFDSVRQKRTYTKMEEVLLLVFSKMLVNITERQLVEGELLAAKERAEESDKLKSAFLANMSHEIRTPMNGILGFAELLQEQDISGDKKDRYVDIIRKSGNRMLETLNDIIDISRIDSGQMEIHKSITDLNEVIESQFIFFKQEALNNGLGLKLYNELPKHNSSIETDKVKLDSIVSNLIKNAIKYTKEGSIEIFCVKVGSNLEIKVKDTGIGIPKDRLNSIFNRFEQADISDKHAREGSGLGLSITKAYIEMLSGEIGVESIEGKGSTFWFTIPWVTNEEVISTEKKAPESESNTDDKKQYNILVVEDDDISFDHMDIILKSISKHTVRAKNGKDAVEYIKNNDDTELVLMDIKLPIMSGTDATKEIRKFNTDIIIIAQTAYGLSGDSKMAFEAGCNDYISKPIDKEKLFELIEKHLG